MAYIFPTFLFCFAKAFVFVITQFKKPHLSRSRSPLRLLLLFAPLMLCDHHLIFEKAKAWNHLHIIMESFKHIYNNTKNKQRNEKCSDIWCLLKIKCMNFKGKMVNSSRSVCVHPISAYEVYNNFSFLFNIRKKVVMLLSVTLTWYEPKFANLDFTHIFTHIHTHWCKQTYSEL